MNGYLVLTAVIFNILYTVFFIIRFNSMVSKTVNKKTAEVEAALKDSEDMINEINNISDYVVARLEEENKRLDNSHRKVEEFYKKTETGHKSVLETIRVLDRKIVDAKEVLDLLQENIDKVKNDVEENQDKEKEGTSLPSNKHRKAVELLKQGKSVTDVAKELNIGKGEVQLLSGFKKTKNDKR